MKKLIQVWMVFFVFLQMNMFANEAKTVLITGGAGFIGSNFVDYMFNRYPDYRFIVLDALTYAGSLENVSEEIRRSDRFQFVQGSIVNTPLVDELMSSCDYVVHFAAETHVSRSILDDFIFFETNVLGTRSLMAALVKHASTVKRFVYISTSEVYGTAEETPISETHPINPRTPYAAAKAGADRLVYAYCKTYDIPVVTLRPFNNYGPKQHPEKMLAHFITSAILNNPLTIHGDGSQTRDWLFTLDLAAAVDRALHIADFSKIKNQEINIGTGVDISVLEIAKKILKHFDLPESYLIYEKDRPGQVQCHISSTQKAKDLLGWFAETSFDEGLSQTINWYQHHLNRWISSVDVAVVSVHKERMKNEK